jgi:N6-L-threonylcarbamoyladenine synthase
MRCIPHVTVGGQAGSSLVTACSNLRMAWRATRVLAKELNVLALESSADDTCAAIVTSTRKILSNVVIKQNIMSVSSTSRVIQTFDILALLYRHEVQGGIHPFDAMMFHQRNMVST